ncbi:MAG: sigma-70 family RNA polymerase sigma factor [Cellulophaga sp.]
MIKESDSKIFCSLKNGSEIAFKEVYQKNRMLFLNFARKYGLKDEDIFDIYQDAYIAFYENIQNGKLVELKSSIATYLISIGKYMILDRLRKNKRKVNQFVLVNVSDIDEQIESFDIGMEELSQEQILLQKYFGELGAKCREILTMFYYKKMNIKEIKEEGNYNSDNVVKSQKSRCLKTLKDTFKNSPK